MVDLTLALLQQSHYSEFKTMPSFLKMHRQRLFTNGNVQFSLIPSRLCKRFLPFCINFPPNVFASLRQRNPSLSIATTPLDAVDPSLSRIDCKVKSGQMRNWIRLSDRRWILPQMRYFKRMGIVLGIFGHGVKQIQCMPRLPCGGRVLTNALIGYSKTSVP